MPLAQALIDWLDDEAERFGFSVPLYPGRPAVAPDASRARAPTAAGLELLAARVAQCRRCRLSEGRTRTVFGRGSPQAHVVFVGEGPGYHEDQQGLPFVGPAGKLLDRMIAAMNLGPETVYICNVVKCRPPDNRTPLPDEAAACAPYLDAQLRAIRPQAIVALGRPAAERLGVVEPGGRGWRGRWAEWEGIPLMATYHPAYLLRNPAGKAATWNDLQAVMARLQVQ